MSLRGQRGVSIITAIVLITVLATLAGAALHMTRSTQADTGLDLQALRARLAARSALEAGFWRVTRPSPAVCTAFNISNLPATLSPYTVSVSCVSAVYGPVTRYALQAVACNQPLAGACPNNAVSAGDNYVEAVVTGECFQQGATFQCR